MTASSREERVGNVGRRMGHKDDRSHAKNGWPWARGRLWTNERAVMPLIVEGVVKVKEFPWVETDRDGSRRLNHLLSTNHG